MDQQQPTTMRAHGFLIWFATVAGCCGWTAMVQGFDINSPTRAVVGAVIGISEWGLAAYHLMKLPRNG